MFFDYQRKWQFIESCIFGVIAAFIPWRRSWSGLRARFSHFAKPSE
jgi:hypothetical protein